MKKISFIILGLILGLITLGCVEKTKCSICDTMITDRSTQEVSMSSNWYCDEPEKLEEAYTYSTDTHQYYTVCRK